MTSHENWILSQLEAKDGGFDSHLALPLLSLPCNQKRRYDLTQDSIKFHKSILISPHELLPKGLAQILRSSLVERLRHKKILYCVDRIKTEKNVIEN